MGLNLLSLKIQEGGETVVVIMVKHRPNKLIERATKHDLEEVLSWLKREYREDCKGFWSNRGIIKHSFENVNLWVIREDGEAVAFQVGDYATDILCVRKDRQRRGFGTALFKSSLARAMKDNLNVLAGECSPQSSLPFWQKQGFERDHDPSGYGKISVRKVLQREYDVPAGLPKVKVTISFYPEAALYRPNVSPLEVNHLVGSLDSSGAIKISRRVIGLADDEPENRDLVVKIVVNGVERCFRKAKHPEAEAVGVLYESKDRTFYIDEVAPTTG